jgi:NADPH:quinone reductase-like Zn-dependent oxidoreductase
MTQAAIPKTMTAAVLTGHGGLDKLVVHSDWPIPEPQAGEVLIKVSACGMNNTDVNTRVGWYDDSISGSTRSGAEAGFDSVSDASTATWGSSTLTFPRIQGADVVGQVVALGDGVSADWPGARVMSDNWLRDWAEPMNRDQSGYLGSERDGGYAQYVALPISNLGRPDSDWSDAELATLSCAYTTAENMLVRARVVEADTVLVTGASGGVGSALVQLCKRRGATVIALTNAAKADEVRAIGPDAIIRRGIDDWQDVIRSVTAGGTITVAADVVGGPVFAALLQVLARGGRYVCSGAIGGKRVEVDISHLYLNDWELIGSTLTQPHVFRDLIGYVERGEIRPLLAKTFPLSEIHAAQTEFLAKQHVGKLVLIPPV